MQKWRANFRAQKSPVRRAILLLTSAIALSSAGLAIGGSAAAQQAAAPSSAEAAPQEVVIIGTRRTDRTLTNSASPVDVISGSELKAQPSSNMLDTLKNIVPSFFVPQNTISDASSFVRAPSLRGLPGDEVLVMLDGKRYNRSALVQVYTGGDTGLSFGSQGSDLSALPSIAVGSLQVLREGATAQYGSDAIAGVLDYGLRTNSSGTEIQARYGDYPKYGDGESREVAFNQGVSLFGRGFANFSAEFDNDDGTSRGATRPLAAIFAQQNPALASLLPNYPKPVQIWGSSPSHGYKLLLNSALNVTDSSQFYFFANYAHSEATESFNYRSPISGTAVDVTGVSRSLGANGAFTNTFYLTPCPAATATCPTGGFVKDNNTFQFSSIYPAGFTPQFVGVTNEAFATLGYKGTMASGLHYDLSASESRNTLNLSMYDSLNASYGPLSPTTFRFGELVQGESDANLDLTYPIAVSAFASPVTLSGGAEWRQETYEQTAGDVYSYGVGPYAVAQNLYAMTAPGVYTPAGSTSAESPGASGYGGTSPAAAGKWSQTSYAGYLGAEADITNSLSTGVAVRDEHYDTFGNAVVGKVNALYKFSDYFSVRGTIGTGFHAPSPGQSNDEILTTNFVGGNQVQTGTYPVGSTVAAFFGAKTLKPEKSKNYGLGFVAKPLSNFTLTVDAYQIDVTDRIGISENYIVTAADVAAQPALAAVGVDGNVNYFTNGFNTSTKGVDVVGTYKYSAGALGRFNLTVAYNYNHSLVTKYDDTVISTAQIIDVSRLAPAHHGNVALSWFGGNWVVTGRENVYSSWRDEVDYPGQVFSPKLTTDLDVSYSVENYTLSAGATNLFNTMPDKVANSSSNHVYQLTNSLSDGEIYPRSGGPFGINGAFGYVRLTARY
jgi:iron complex outermembrane receptor protein